MALVGGMVVPLFVYADQTKLTCLSIIWNRNKNPNTFPGVAYNQQPTVSQIHVVNSVTKSQFDRIFQEMIDYREPRMMNQRRDFI